MSAAEWADAIGATIGDSGMLTRSDIATHVRSAVRAAGTLRRGQITRGLNEAYAPFGIEDGAIPPVVDQVVQDLVLIGDLTELKTTSGAAYILTPPRLLVIEEDRATVLGASSLEPGGTDIARQLPAADWPAPETMLRVDLGEELGLPDWRLFLVEIGGVDAPLATAETLFSHIGRLSEGGERLETLTPDKVRVLSGRQAFFGRYDGVQPEGRWHPASADGVYCAVRHVGHGWRPCVLTIHDGRASIWEADSRDVWRWAVVGQTLSVGDPVHQYDEAAMEFSLHVPPPRQVRKLLALAAEPKGPWRWRTSPSVAAAVAALLTDGTIEP